ncbi:MAG: Mrp/NBP35 family ATP-binding protein [Bdellovibrionales bacterium]
MNPFSQQASIPGVRKIIAVGSGKGGVGKSTVAANLAVALKNAGHKVGLLDADIYGPSVPRLFGALHQRPDMDSSQKIAPLVRHGIKLMSIGFMVDEEMAVVWRGPMLFKAMEQFFRDVAWGELDYLIIDLPPGTGDVALTVAQKVPVDGAIVVCTPQNMALTDAKKAISMFEQVKIPVLGVVENMAYMEVGGEKVQLFPRGELHAFLDSRGIKRLAEVPFNPQVALACEAGIPAVDSSPSSVEAKAFNQLAGGL